jgi:hypothetical protein
MKIAFTLCSNNYLAQAKTLGDSIKLKNPEYQFFIGLVDTLSPEIDYDEEIGHQIILSNEIEIPDFDDLWKKYSIIEFNTCVKPFYFQYFIKKFKPIDFLFYLDPDILIYDDIKIIENEFDDTAGLLLTPHILSPIPLDDKTPGENIFLNYGVFNLGFLGLKNPELSIQFIEWWKERTYHLGFDQTEKGLFVDQLWFNLVPIFFKNVKISKHPGLNMAPWNLHERKLSGENAILFLNQSVHLVFYHFSKYKFNEQHSISDRYDRYVFKDNPALQKLYTNYHKLLRDNGIEKYSEILCFYMVMRKEYFENEERKKEIEKMNMIMSSPSKKIKYYMKKILPDAFIRIYGAIMYRD